MNLAEVNWDLNAAGSWPFVVKAVVVSLVFVVSASVGVYYYNVPELDVLTALEKEEQNLKTVFEFKQKKAANLQDYREQLSQIEGLLEQMLKQMPTKAEVADLLVDISQTGLASGLEFKLFQPGPEVQKEFYWELPINIQVVGQYNEIGRFVSGLASLPRIVTVHDVSMVPNGQQKQGLTMSAVIKTYNEGEKPLATPAANRKKP